MFIENIKRLTKENTNFRKVLCTGKYSQVVAMSISVGQEIGEEVHPETDQIFFIVDGEGEAIISGELKKIEEHDIVYVVAGTVHNIKNTGDEELKLCTIYSPPHHPEGTVQATKVDGDMGGTNK